MEGSNGGGAEKRQRSFRNHEGNAEDNVDKKKKDSLYFAYKVDALKSFTLFFFVKTIWKLNMEHNVKFETANKKLAVLVHVLQTKQNLAITRCCFAEDGKEMYQEL